MSQYVTFKILEKVINRGYQVRRRIIQSSFSNKKYKIDCQISKTIINCQKNVNYSTKNSNNGYTIH